MKAITKDFLFPKSESSPFIPSIVVKERLGIHRPTPWVFGSIGIGPCLMDLVGAAVDKTGSNEKKRNRKFF
jgi:hypothetical protein